MKKQNEQMPVKFKPLGCGQNCDYGWERSLNLILFPGCFTIEIDHANVDVGLPVDFCGSEHYIVGTLIVTDSGNYVAKQDERVIGQILLFTNRYSKNTNVYIRNYIQGNWSEWRSLALTGMYENIASTDELVSTVEGLVAETNVLQITLQNEIERATVNEKMVKGTLGNILTIPGYINTKGKETSNESYRCSDYCFLSHRSGIIIRNAFAGESSLLVAFYDKNKTFISGVYNATEANISPEEFPENTVYARFSSRLPVDDTIIQLSNIADVTASVGELDAVTVENTARLNNCEKNVARIVNKSLPLAVYGFYYSTGQMSTTENAMRTELVEIGKYTKLRYSTSIGANGAAVAFFDGSKKYIAELSVNGTGSLISGVVDLADAAFSNVKYVAISYYDQKKLYEGYEALLYEENSLDTRFEEVEKVSPYIERGLKVLVFGDSITTCADIAVNEQLQTISYTLKENSNGYTNDEGVWTKYSMWPFLMTKYLHCSDVRNYALAGASYKESQRESGSERQNLSYQVQLALNDRTNPNGVFPTDGDFVPDVVIFALGTNDGTPNDTYESAMEKTVMSADGISFDVDATLANLDVKKTCEAIRFAFLKVKKSFPHSLCLCVLPIQRADMENPGINDALEKMAKRYSIKVIDGYSELGIVRDLEVWNGFGTNLKDGLHPNDKGQKLYTRMIVSAIKNNWMDIERYT